MRKENVYSALGHVARLVLGVVFIFSGSVKAIDPLGTVYKIEDYLKAFGGFFTELMPLAMTAAVCLIVVEILLGLCLVLNIQTRWMAWLSLAFYLVMTPLTLYVALTNPVSDCGCFGDAVVLTNWQTFWKNIVLLAFVILLLCCRKHIYPTWVGTVEWVFAVLTVIGTLGFMAWTVLNLPVKDFRPYKIGNNIPELMAYPEDAEPDQYELTFIYEKDGVEQEFTLQNYPKNDSTWTFVDQRSILVKKGYEPPIHDFELMSLEFEDLTYDILDSDEPVSLFICYDLDKTNRRQAAKMSELGEHLSDKGEDWFIVTGSGEQTIEAFAASFGLDIEHFLNCDPVTLKTIVRANPGLIRIQRGTIIDKQNVRNIDLK